MTWIGGTIEKQVTFRDTNGDLADPTVVNGNAKNPDGVSVVASSILNPSVGVYDVLYNGNVAGLWYYRIEGEGGGVDAVIEGSFCVRESSVE